MDWDVIIIGAGASGLMSALEAGRRGRKVALLDHNAKPGAKIRVSGGGRCNFSNRFMDAGNYISQNPDFCRSALKRFTPDDFISLLRQYRIPYEEREEGQLFCKTDAGAVTDMLVKECRANHVTFMMNQPIVSVGQSVGFKVRTRQHTLHAASLIVATGGLSWPRLGASDLGYRLARQFRLNIIDTRPGLTPLWMDRQQSWAYCNLSGISFKAQVSCGKKRVEGHVLFTHHGLSGPAILQISNFWNHGNPLIINVLPGQNLRQLIRDCGRKRITLMSLLSAHLPKRFLKTLLEPVILNTPVSDISVRRAAALDERLRCWTVYPQSAAGYRYAEVTLGGVDTRELSSRTMECRSVPGLYFTGEVLDVTGRLGGYNLHWAWASGSTAGQYA